jgi:uncharacterized protein (TIRG00374 family)
MRGPSRARLRRVAAGAVGIGVSVLALAFLAMSANFGEAGAALAQARGSWIVAALALIPLFIVMRTWRWTLLLPRRDDGRRPELIRVVAPLLIGNLANLVLPARVGEPVRAYLLARRERLPFAGVLGSIGLERAIDVATLAAIGLPAAIVAGAATWMTSGLAILAGVGTVAIIVLASPILWAVSARIARVRAIEEHPVFARASRLILSFIEGARGSGVAGVVGAVAISTVTWGFVALLVWLLGQSLGIGLTPAGAMVVAAVISLGSAIPSAPAAIGTYELVSVLAGSAVGLSRAEALALGVLTHVVTTLPFVLAGGAAVSSMGIRLGDVASRARAARADASLAAEGG